MDLKHETTAADGWKQLERYVARLPVIINNSSTPMEAVDNGVRIDGGEMVRQIVLRDARRA